MRKNYVPTFIQTCKKLSVYVTEHEHIMLKTLENSEHASEEEIAQIIELMKQLKNMSAIFQKLNNKF